MKKLDMKKLLLIGALAMMGNASIAQVHRCGTDEHFESLANQHPAAKEAKQKFDADYLNFRANYNPNDYKTAQQLGKKANPKFIIPVVVHVFHNNGSENITEAQINSEINFLNKSFRNLNSDTINRRKGWFKPVANGPDSFWYDYKSLAADVEVEFRLAKKDPQGNCTNGIVRIATPLTSKGNDDLKKTSVWDTKRYFNMWVVRSINRGNSIGIAGYAQFPFGFGGGASTDGIMVIHNEFGNVGTSQPGQTPTVTTTTHEVGHWLGLYHPFQISSDSCGLDGDGVMDTPPTYFNPSSTEPLRNRCNNKSFNTCSSEKPDLPDMQEAYMDYFIGNCASNMFTLEQKARMHYVLNNIRKTLWSDENLKFTGVVDGPATCPPLAAFNTQTQVTCAKQKISFTDFSYGGVISTYEWTFEGGDPATFTGKTPPQITYNNPGKFDVTLKVTGPNGTTTTVLNDYITIQPEFSQTPAAGAYFADWWYQNNWQEQGWTFTYDVPKNQFTRFPISYENNASMRLTRDPFNINSSIGNLFSLVSPSYDLSNFDSRYFEFYYAFAQGTLPTSIGGGNTTEELKVYTSTDCGKTWQTRTTVGSTAISTIGTGTAAVLGSTIDFMPADKSKWKQVLISGASVPKAANVKFKIEFKYQGGNNFYLDNVRLGTTTGTSQVALAESINLKAQPNPFSQSSLITYELSTKEVVSINLFDITGKFLGNVFSGNQTAGTQEVEINRNQFNLSSGIYFVELNIGGKKLSHKVVVE
jgi:PKD repeat protein